MICPICEKEVDSFHKKSHIIPDSLYENAYDEKHKILSGSFHTNSVKSVQTGAHSSIMCIECESKSNDRADQYAAILLKGYPQRLVQHYGFKKRIGPLNLREKAEFWSNLDFKKFQNFVFITILRNELHLRSIGKSIIGEKHFKRIRDIYNDDNLIESELYPIAVLKNTPNEEDFQDVVIMPASFNQKNSRGVIFRIMGYVFITYIASHKKHSPYERFFLQKEGSLIIRYEKFMSHKNNRKDYMEMARMMIEYKSRQNLKLS